MLGRARLKQSQSHLHTIIDNNFRLQAHTQLHQAAIRSVHGGSTATADWSADTPATVPYWHLPALKVAGMGDMVARAARGLYRAFGGGWLVRPSPRCLSTTRLDTSMSSNEHIFTCTGCHAPAPHAGPKLATMRRCALLLLGLAALAMGASAMTNMEQGEGQRRTHAHETHTHTHTHTHTQ